MRFNNGQQTLKRLVDAINALRPGHATVCYIGFTIGKYFVGVAWLGAPAVCPVCGKELSRLLNDRHDVVGYYCIYCDMHVGPEELRQEMPFDKEVPNG